MLLPPLYLLGQFYFTKPDPIEHTVMDRDDFIKETLPDKPTPPPPTPAEFPSYSVADNDTSDTQPKQIRESFEALRREYDNDDIVGHLKIEGTPIDFIVTQYVDNNFYLHHDIHRNASKAGWVFLDYENDITGQDRNMIIYGHNMRSGAIFGSLSNYASEDFFKEHRYITFNTLFEDYTWEIFSCYITSTDFYYIQVIFPSEEDFGELVAEMKARSIYDTGVEVTAQDRVLTLSTCSDGPRDERFVINAKLVDG